MKRLFAVALLCAALPAGGAAASPLGQRQIPVGVSNVNDQTFTSERYVYALRFVVDRDTRIHRFFSGFNLEGTTRLGGRPHYAHGNGGYAGTSSGWTAREGRISTA